MSRNPGDAQSGTRFSALWGTGNRGGEHRSSALWGTGSRGGEHRSRRNTQRLLTTAIAVVALVLPMGAVAGDENGKGYVSAGARQAAANNPGGKVRVIIQSSRSVADARAAAGGAAGSVLDELGIINGVVAEIPSAAIEGLSNAPGLIVTLDAPVKASAYTSTQLWPHENGVSKLWGTDINPAPKAPAIAVVDTGIDSSLPDFGSRVIHRAVLTRLAQDPAKLDGRGHGSMVASIAAGEAPGYAGASPTSNLIDLDVMNDAGMAFTSDVIKAADWILANKDAYGIRVANFSLHSTAVLSIKVHPLNRAVQKLWLSGVVVVAAVGNYGIPTGPSGVRHAPGNDPFVISVGALDIGGTARISDDSVASWSAYGYTLEGFAKPEVVASGRFMVGAVPMSSTLVAERPDKVVAPGYLQMSGTSFAAPIVAGIAAQLLARHPEWTPDQVKGALMKTARRVVNAPQLAQGRGQVNAVRGFTVQVVPNGNGHLNRFVGPDTAEGASGNAFNAASWYDAMKLNAAWDSAAWFDAAWNEAAWFDAAWNEAAWNEAAWNEAAWADAAWADSETYEDYAGSDPTSTDILLDPVDELDIAADPDLALP